MSTDVLGRQHAFVGLLGNPVVTRSSHPELWPLIHRHRSVLTDWYADRLGYRLTITDSAARLFRLPSEGRVTAPKRVDPPSRRILVLAILAAAAAEDVEDVVSTQELSDRVRVLSRNEEVELAVYEPDRYSERQLFVKAIRVLVSVGALQPLGQTTDEQGDSWAQRHNAVGGAYRIRRELLLRMIDPACLRAALAPPGAVADDASPRYGVLRRLLELPVCLFEDLTEAERSYLTSQRRRLLAWCSEMTGWVAEQRAEGIALVATDEADTDLPFPLLRAADFTTLMVLNQLLRDPGIGPRIGAEQFEQAAAEVAAWHPKALTKELRIPGSLEDSAITQLTALDLLRPGEEPGTHRLTPAAARFRDPQVVEATARLDEGPADE